MDNVKSKINLYIKDARETSKLTQVAMAKALGIARQTYLDLENGKTEPRVSMLLKICEVTNKPLGFFIQGDLGLDDVDIILLKKRRKDAREHLEAVLRLL